MNFNIFQHENNPQDKFLKSQPCKCKGKDQVMNGYRSIEIQVNWQSKPIESQVEWQSKPIEIQVNEIFIGKNPLWKIH